MKCLKFCALIFAFELLGCLTGPIQGADRPFLKSELIIPLEHWHNHASCIVELPNGDLFVTWYHGSGERKADDVVIEGARLPHGSRTWSPRFLLADTPNFPDANPALLLDSQQRLWLLWPVIIANRWETALMRYRISSDYEHPGPPRWDVNDIMLFIPRNFEEKVKSVDEPNLPKAKDTPQAAYLQERLKHAADKYFRRMGWMPRVHPLQLPSGRILVPLYSDGFDFSLIAITDDGGKTWTTSEPLVGYGNIQPALVRKRDGTIVAYMRHNGPPPYRIQMSTSKDDGVTWSPVEDTQFRNPGSGVDVVGLKDGSWVLIYNDTERNRYSLAVSLSDDEGKTWKWTRHLERDTREKPAGAFHYPSIIQAKDGTLHASYSYYPNDPAKGGDGQAIKHAHFNVAWIKQGDR